MVDFPLTTGRSCLLLALHSPLQPVPGTLYLVLTFYLRLRRYKYLVHFATVAGTDQVRVTGVRVLVHSSKVKHQTLAWYQVQHLNHPHRYPACQAASRQKWRMTTIMKCQKRLSTFRQTVACVESLLFLENPGRGISAQDLVGILPVMK